MARGQEPLALPAPLPVVFITGPQLERDAPLLIMKHIRKHEAEKITEDRIKFIRSKIEEGQTEFTEWAIQLSDMCDWIIISKMTLTKYIINWHKKSTKTDRLEKTDPKDVVINATTNPA